MRIGAKFKAVGKNACIVVIKTHKDKWIVIVVRPKIGRALRAAIERIKRLWRQVRLKLKLIAWALLGRPIIYNCNFKSGIHIDGRNVLIADCTFGIDEDTAVKLRRAGR